MSNTNSLPGQGETAALEREALLELVTTLREQLAEVTRQRDEAREEVSNYEAMYRLWDEEGVAPPAGVSKRTP